ncbi:MAG TPA: arylesterase [Rheinheimera sp.]|nr:arylesterase [Rheinheimera sp.]
MRIYSILCIGLLLISPLQAKTMLILGDSLSAGYGLPTEQSWPQMLDRELADWDFTNASISGETSQGALNRLPALLATNPDALLVEIGANDGLRGYPVQRIRTNIQQIIDMARQAQIKVVLMQIRIPPNYGPRYTQQFETMYQELATENNLVLWPFFMEKIAVDPTLMQPDGLHPNAKGQPLIVEQLKPLFEQLK